MMERRIKDPFGFRDRHRTASPVTLQQATVLLHRARRRRRRRCAGTVAVSGVGQVAWSAPKWPSSSACGTRRPSSSSTTPLPETARHPTRCSSGPGSPTSGGRRPARGRPTPARPTPAKKLRRGAWRRGRARRRRWAGLVWSSGQARRPGPPTTSSRVRQFAGTRKVGHAGTSTRDGDRRVGRGRTTVPPGSWVIWCSPVPPTIRCGWASPISPPTTPRARCLPPPTPQRSPRRACARPSLPRRRPEQVPSAVSAVKVDVGGVSLQRVRGRSEQVELKARRPSTSSPFTTPSVPKRFWRAPLGPLLERDLHPRHRPRPRRRARRVAPDGAAPHCRRVVRPGLRPHRSTSWPRPWMSPSPRPPGGSSGGPERPRRRLRASVAGFTLDLESDGPSPAPRTASSAALYEQRRRGPAGRRLLLVRWRLPLCVWRSVEEVPADLGRTVVTIGNFDGVHLGHQHVVKCRAREVAADLSLQRRGGGDPTRTRS